MNSVRKIVDSIESYTNLSGIVDAILFDVLVDNWVSVEFGVTTENLLRETDSAETEDVTFEKDQMTLTVTTEMEETHQTNYADFDIRESYALIDASEDSALEYARMLMLGFDVNLQDKNGWTLLMLACQMGYTRVAKLFLDRGADVGLKNKVGESALTRAIVAGSTEAVKMLLQAGADVGILTKDGWSSLMFACQNGDTDTVKELLNRGVDVNHQTKAGISALMIASDGNYLEIVEMLLDEGADVDHQNKVGESALSIAMELDNHQSADPPKILTLLLNKATDRTVFNHRAF